MNEKAQLLLDSDREATYEVETDAPTESTAHDDALEEFLYNSKAVGSDAIIIVRKVQDSGNPNSTTSFCGQFPVDKYDYFALQNIIKTKWGGGDFRLFVSAVKNGKRKLMQNQLITIEADNEPQKSGENSEVVALLREVLNRQSPPQAQSTTGVIGQVKEMAELMALLRPPPEPTRNPMKEFMETMGMMQTLGFMPGGAPSEEINPMWDSLAKALPALISGAMENKQHAHVIHQNPKKPHPKQDKKNSMITYYLKQLEEYATNNVSSESVADTIVEKAPDFDMLMTIVSRPDFISHHTASGFWAKSDYREWLIDVREWLLGHDGKPSKYSDQFGEDEKTAFDSDRESDTHFTAHNLINTEGE